MSHFLLTCNAGSNSLKCALFEADSLKLAYRMEVDRIHTQSILSVFDAQGTALIHEEPIEAGYEAALGHILNWQYEQGCEIAAVGHRVVHGGRKFEAPVRVSEETKDEIQKLIPLAPLHQPHNLRLIEILEKQFPALLQTACFDTAFHRTQPALNQQYALPRELTEEEDIVRYGFHGLSYDYIAGKLPEYLPAAERVIVVHLGSGASACAMRNGKSIATTMGFTALDGLMMSTRCGDLDPGVVLYLMQHKGMSAQAIETLLYKESGLLGVSGISGDMRDLDDKESKQAQQAVALFCQTAARQISGLLPLLGGMDALVFTGAMGVHDFLVRAMICDHFKWLNLVLDEVHNAENETTVSSDASAIPVLVIPTDEELVIARQTQTLI